MNKITNELHKQGIMHRLRGIIKRKIKPSVHTQLASPAASMEICMNMDERCICAHTLLAIAAEHNIQLWRKRGKGPQRGAPEAKLAGELRDYWPRPNGVGLEIRRLTSV